MKSIFIKISCFIMIFSLPIFAQFVADSNTVALYHFDEGNENIVTDASGKNNNGWLNNNNAWTTDGKFGSALKLNGSSDYVMIPDNPAQSPTKGFTIEAWIKIISYPSGQTNSTDNTGIIIHKGIDNDFIHETYHLRLLNNGKLSFISERANTCGGIIASYIQLTSNSILSQNQWYNIAVTFDSLTNTGKLYIDNLLDTLSLAQMGQHYTQTCTLPITIGADTLTNPNGIINYFDGYIDELRISDIARQYNLFVSTDSVSYTVYPSQNTFLIPSDFSAAVTVKLPPDIYDVTASFNSAHAGGDLDGVFFAAQTGETSTQWPQGHSILESFHTSKTTIDIQNAADTVTGYLFFEDGSDLSDNPGSAVVAFKSTTSTNEFDYTVYPNQNTLLIPGNFSTPLQLMLAPGTYDVTALFNGAHAGGDLDGVFFAAHTGETSAQWPQGHAILESFHTTKTTISLSDAPDSVTGYLFFEDGSNLGDNPGSVTVTFVKTSATYIAIESAKIPSDFNLGQNYPNPFNPTTTIIYELSKSNLVKLKVFDVLGMDVATLVNEEKAAGRYQVHFDASKLSSGVYFYRMQAGDFVQSKKLILLK